MAEKEVEIINHLLEVEQNAAALTLQAQEEADKKISVAKAQADARFKEEYEQIVKNNEKKYEEKIVEADAKAKSDIEKFKADVSTSEKKVDEFNSYLDKILFA